MVKCDLFMLAALILNSIDLIESSFEITELAVFYNYRFIEIASKCIWA